MKKILLITLFLLFGCTKTVSRNIAFPSPTNEAQKLSWTGDGCSFGTGTLKLSADKDTKANCESSIISIVPGHHSLLTELKANGLLLSKDRYLNEALSLRIRYFDALGVEVPTTIQFLGQQIDAGELSYALNRVDSDALIDRLGFTKIHLVPRYYPFDEGWIPQQVTSIQFVFSLVGPGTVQFKNLEVRRSKWNYNLQQRVFNALNQIDQKYPQLFPEPQKAVWSGKTFSFVGDGTKLPLKIAIDNKITKSEGYKLEIIEKQKRLSIMLTGADHRGVTYGLQTLSQLVQVREGKVFIPEVSITDYPTFSLRSVSGRDSQNKNYHQEIAAASWLPESRLNALILETNIHEKGWLEQPQSIINAAKLISEHAKKDKLIDFGIIVNPYLMKPGKEGVPFSFASEAHRLSFIELGEKYKELGIKHFIYSNDDFPPRLPGQKFGYVLSASDELKFPSLANAQLSLLKETASKLHQVKFYFVPTWYNPLFADLSNGFASPYLDEISKELTGDVPIIWTGPTVRSLFIDHIQERRFSNMIGGRTPMWWDNTLYARRHEQFWGKDSPRLNLTSYIEPFDVSVDAKIFKGQNRFFSNSHLSELYRIQLATLGAFLWNPSKYNPEVALYRYLFNRFGKEATERLLEFDSLLAEYRASKDSSIADSLQRLLEQLSTIEQPLYQELVELWNEIK